MKVRVKHYRNGLTHYRAYRALRDKGMSHAAAWKYVQKYVTAPADEPWSPTGGMTVVEVRLEKSGLRFYAEAHCSMEDVFVKEIGVDIAMERIVAQMEKVAFKLAVANYLAHAGGFPCLVVRI
ncbi:MAG: hypothetical protein M0R06_12310 [Sphaerochaeta sp.]|jgi:hypothetical protein|nr:hypothetical protein [Sphaerochaeta sp.]